MKLIELNPRWCSAGTGNRHGMGLSFDCPVHRDHRLAVMFVNPVDGGPSCSDSHYLWHRTGDTFDVLTLGPSIDASGFTAGTHDIKTPCWHGFIQNGEVSGVKT